MAHNGKTTNSSGWNAVFSWIKYALTGKRDETKAVSQSSVNASSLVDLDARLRALETALAQGQLGNVEADSLDAPTVKVGGVDVKTKQSVPTFSPDLTKTVSAMSQTANGDLSATFAEVQATVSSQNNYTLPSSKTNLSTIFGKIWNFFGMLLKSTGTWDGTSDSQIPTTAAVQAKLDGKANKVINGNGNLAVIDSNGNYVSSGITAYNQSAVNSLVSSLEAYAGRGQYVHTRSVTIETSSGHEGKLFSFTNLRTGITVLDIGMELGGEDLNSLQFYLPISSSEANEWIWETQTPGVPIAVAEVWSTRGMLTMSPTPGNSSVATHSETRIDAYNGTAPDAALISMRHFGSINVGPSGSAYDAFSKVNATLLLRNTITAAFAFVDLSIGVSHYASNNPYPKIWGVATCISDGIE